MSNPHDPELASNYSHYSFVELEQGTSEWRHWRNGGIGSSDAPIIMCEASFSSPQRLLREKRLQRSSSKAILLENSPLTPAMESGNRLEPLARQAYSVRIEQSVRPVCLQSQRFAWMRASLDGMTSAGDRAVEIKCGEVAYKKASKTGRCPQHYYAQIQHIIAITGLEQLDLWCYRPELDPVLIPVPRDEAYIRTLLRAEEAFWRLVESAESAN